MSASIRSCTFRKSATISGAMGFASSTLSTLSSRIPALAVRNLSLKLA